ncbi:MAG: hypothetical protein LBV43_12455 [Prevotella sp.]|jgi:hypothetical protein|nr:hypothetical protein [Prevotella sp.]
MKSLTTTQQADQLLLKIRLLTVFYIFSLFFWGITAFPLETEIRILSKILDISFEAPAEYYDGIKRWIATVANGLIDTNQHYPFLAYGFDWLAFSHLVIAVAFIGLYIKPVRNKWIVYFGMIACIGVVPLALICGGIRGIPLAWRLIDCSFCVFGMIPLILLHHYIKKLEVLIEYPTLKY